VITVTPVLAFVLAPFPGSHLPIGIPDARSSERLGRRRCLHFDIAVTIRITVFFTHCACRRKSASIYLATVSKLFLTLAMTSCFLLPVLPLGLNPIRV